MFKPNYDFEWDLLGIYYYNLGGNGSYYFQFINDNLDKDGDLIKYRNNKLSFERWMLVKES